MALGDAFVVFVWRGFWTIARDGYNVTEREAHRVAADYDAPTRVRAMKYVAERMGLPENPGDEMGNATCPFCGSTVGTESYPEGEWPRCRDCGAC